MAHTYCKNVDVTSPGLIAQAIMEVYDSGKDRRRMAAYMGDIVGMPANDVWLALKVGDICVPGIIAVTAAHIGNLIRNRGLQVREIHYSERYDDISQKMRLIGRQHVETRILDHLMVISMQDLFRRIGAMQCASIPGRGQLYGATKISEWLRNTAMKYFTKMDVRKCYESIDPQVAYNKVAARVNNPNLLYVLKVLLASHVNGLSIGSYLSQWLCNYCLSDAYHFVTEQCLKTRRGKTSCEVDHVVFYMDDILLLGANKRGIERAAKKLEKFLADDLGVAVKPWAVYNVNTEIHGNPWFIDMMGFRCHRGFLTIRRKTWRKLRKAMIHASKFKKRMPLKLAFRILSYYGYLKHAGQHMLKRIKEWEEAIAVAKYMVSQWSKNNATLRAQICEKLHTEIESNSQWSSFLPVLEARRTCMLMS